MRPKPQAEKGDATLPVLQNPASSQEQAREAVIFTMGKTGFLVPYSSVSIMSIPGQIQDRIAKRIVCKMRQSKSHARNQQGSTGNRPRQPNLCFEFSLLSRRSAYVC